MTFELSLLFATLVITFLNLVIVFIVVARIKNNKAEQVSATQNQAHLLEQSFSDIYIKLVKQQHSSDQKTQQILFEKFQSVNQLLSNNNQRVAEQLTLMAKVNREEQTASIEKLTQSTDKRLQEISGQVDKRLAEGFDKTTQTFNDILKRLALIDDAQKKITELSSNVVSLQEVLADKRSRGAFGEVQLSALVRNVLPESQFSLQHSLSNGKVADCLLFLPKPTGNVVVDAKFPLESYKTMANPHEEQLLRNNAQKQFKQDIKKHINDIASKYLIENETSDGAVMFIPAEAVFAEIHAHHSDLVEYANKQRVWLASPTTLMAILTTARAVIKDEATKQQVHIIQEHLAVLAQDFDRFKGRFGNLARHIDQAANDVKQIHTSADKITRRFEKIEQVEITEPDSAELLTSQD
ncbi:DNA recombination protein RmuC [Thalassotalea sp. M1531]|uniref:DNA recombination protein RmuC n=2 Tax=Thalassotalea algicola TaxID=2716224 RepID=A0A7Y0LBQ7_9GAMM|nr:DNA recombination protein RmuC [Thalassotalea algicola]